MQPKINRCAVYTRKSTDHNLGLAFNSLDAQREACEAYIKSQAHEGWTLVHDRFDDGGLSGASLDRPALQDLLDRVKARQIDIIVVYKVDRLTRSLADFAKLVELFDKHEVSFVSVTQSFNTTTSMGRLTLNVLLSFAQFEREVIGERVRDKIAASKRKGIWVGGPVPLGYRSVDKKLEIIPEEADTVRKIFADYLRLGSVVALANALEAEGIRPKQRVLSNGRVIASERFSVGPLAYMLKNRFYLGEVVYKGEVHPGPQAPILEKTLFEAVQARLAEQAVARVAKRAASPALLTGRLFDDRGNPMTPTHSRKKGVRYRYYTSHALLQGRRKAAGTVARVSAPEIEQRVLAALEGRETHKGEDDAANGSGGRTASDRDRVETRVSRITIHENWLEIVLTNGPGASSPAGPQIVTLPWTAPSAPRKGISHVAAPTRSAIDDDTRATLLAAIARSKAWVDALTDGSATSFAEIAKFEKLAERHVRFFAPLAFVSPQIVEAIVEGEFRTGLTLRDLARNLPVAWSEQERRLSGRHGPASKRQFSERIDPPK